MKEKILRSLNSSDLTQEEWESAAHVVASLGAAQIGNDRQLAIGAMLLHIKAGHIRFLPRVGSLLAAHIQRKARRQRWTGITTERASTVARIALEHFLDPNCPVCHGVGQIGELGQVIVLCSRAEGGCGGTGRKARRFRGWMERVNDAISALERMEGYASAATRRQARE